MTNSITGDYEVVVEVSFDALNRILAALHEAKSEPHSFVWRIGGPSALPGRQTGRTGVAHVAIGGPIVNVAMSASQAKPVSRPGLVRSTVPKTTLGKVSRITVGTAQQPASVIGRGGIAIISPPSGVVEVQVSTPTVTVPVPQDTPTKITVHQWIMIYFIPDADNTAPMPEFIHGELELTVNIALKPLAGGTALNIDLTSKNVQVVFKPIWTSTSLDRNQRDWLVHYIREFLTTKINPMNVTLPQAFQQLNSVDVKFIQTLTSGLGALLLSISPNAPSNPDPGTVSADLVGDGNDFAIAVSSDYLISLIQNRSIPDFTISITINYWIGSTTISYNVHFNPVIVSLSSGKITLTITGHAHTDSIFPDTDFTITQSVSLTVSDSTVTLSALGDPSISLSGALGDIEGVFNGLIVGAIRPRRDQLLQQVQASFQSMLDSQTQSIIQSINNTLNVYPQLGYSDVAIQNDGIILYGNIGFQDQVPVHVEFTQMDIPAPELTTAISSRIVRAHVGSGRLPGPSQVKIVSMVGQIELNALSSWIPGGTIGRFIWSLKRSQDDTHPHVITEQHRFVTRVSKDIPTQYICLTVEGTRVTGETVSGEHCVSNAIRIPILHPPDGLQQILPVAIVTGAKGQPSKTVAYVNPWASTPTSDAVSNETIIHFVDPHSVEKDLTTFREALAAETQASAFVIAVLPHDHIGKIGSIELPANYFLGWADDHNGDWRRTFNASKGPVTVILNRSGAVVWQEHGPTPLAKLKTALKHNLLPGAILSRQQPQTTVTVGKRAPDFPFQYSDKTQMMLSNFYGQPVIIIFWASWSKPSLEELEYLHNNQKQFGKDLVVLAVNDVDGQEKAKETLKKHHLTFPLIVDAQHQIARLYGISCWPTIISIDTKGIIRNISLGTTEKPVQAAKSKSHAKGKRTKK